MRRGKTVEPNLRPGRPECVIIFRHEPDVFDLAREPDDRQAVPERQFRGRLRCERGGARRAFDRLRQLIGEEIAKIDAVDVAVVGQCRGIGKPGDRGRGPARGASVGHRRGSLRVSGCRKLFTRRRHESPTRVPDSSDSDVLGPGNPEPLERHSHLEEQKRENDDGENARKQRLPIQQRRRDATHGRRSPHIKRIGSSLGALSTDRLIYDDDERSANQPLGSTARFTLICLTSV